MLLRVSRAMSMARYIEGASFEENKTFQAVIARSFEFKEFENHLTPGVTEMNLSRYKISNAHADIIAKRSRMLKKLRCREVETRVVLTIVSSCRNLTSIDLSDYQTSDDDVIAIADNCKHLLDCNLSHCDRLTNGAFEALARGCPAIRILRVSGLHNISQGVMCIAHNGKLTRLHMSWANGITRSMLIEIVSMCAMQQLSIAGGDTNDETLRVISRKCPGLKAVKLIYLEVTDAGVYELLRNCPLERLFVGCCDISDALAREIKAKKFLPWIEDWQ
jgi:hypothetical protein